MVGIFRVFVKYGFVDGFNGYVFFCDFVEFDIFWINFYVKYFFMVKFLDLICVDYDGKYVEGLRGLKINIVGFIIYSNIYRVRLDFYVVCYVYLFYGCVWFCFGCFIEMFIQDCCYFYDDLSVYGGFGGVVFVSQEGQELVKQFGFKNKNFILQNYGYVLCFVYYLFDIGFYLYKFCV